MRVTGNTSNWEFKVWQAGIYGETPSLHRPHGPAGWRSRGPALHPHGRLRGRPGPRWGRPGPGRAPRRVHRRHGGHARALHGLARRPRPAGPSRRWLFFAPRRSPPSSGADVPGRSRSPTRAGGSSPSGRLASTTWSVTCTATPSRSSTRCGPRRSLRRRGLEDRQPRPPPRRAHDPARLGLPGRGAGELGPDVVPRAQPGPPAGEQGGDDRRYRGASRRRASTRPSGGTASSG